MESGCMIHLSRLWTMALGPRTMYVKHSLLVPYNIFLFQNKLVSLQVITVKKTDFEVFDALDIDSTTASSQNTGIIVLHTFVEI